MGSKDDTVQIPTQERLKSMAVVKSAAERLQAEGAASTTLAQQHSVPLHEARTIVGAWSNAPKKTAEVILDHYGPPDEATASKLFWHGVGPWSRMDITADQAVHNFPTPHTDYITQYVPYAVPPAKAAELLAFDGSVLIDRTTGELGPRCDHEAFNILTLNLPVEIIESRRSVQDARELYAETAAAYVMGRPAPYAERLLFTPPAQGTADPDEPNLAPEMAEQVAEKIKDMVAAGTPPH
jgi:hypothetical protein